MAGWRAGYCSTMSSTPKDPDLTDAQPVDTGFGHRTAEAQEEVEHLIEEGREDEVEDDDEPLDGPRAAGKA